MHFSLLLPVEQGNRTDLDPRGDGAAYPRHRRREDAPAHAGLLQIRRLITADTRRFAAET